MIKARSCFIGNIVFVLVYLSDFNTHSCGQMRLSDPHEISPLQIESTNLMREIALHYKYHSCFSNYSYILFAVN